MAWYRSGTVSVTNGSAVVIGAATNFVENTRVGDNFIAPDGRNYEITNIASNTAISINPNYLGTTATGQTYAIMPIQGYTKKLADAAAELVNSFGDIPSQLDDKVDKVSGKGLSEADFLTVEKTKLTGIQAGAQVNRDIATQAEAEAGTDNIKAMTPLRTAQLAAPRILDAERRAVERASGGRQTVIYDNSGNASVMYVLPVFRYEDLGLTASMGTGIASAFDVGTGSHKPEIFIGAYHASLVSGKACSVPFADAAASINFDNAKTACTSKGTGWHLMTMHEWAAIALWCEANGFVPRGNTNYGRAHDRVVEYGRRQDGGLPGDASGTARIRAGSGPATWRHDGTLAGISDLVGNVWEWQDGLSLIDGRIKASTFNTQAEVSWALQAAYLDAVAGVTLSDALTTTASTNTPWATMPKSGGYVTNQLLKRMLVEPAGSTLTGRISQNNAGERLPSRGGDWNDGSVAGLGSLSLNDARSTASSSVGFRPAFVS